MRALVRLVVPLSLRTHLRQIRRRLKDASARVRFVDRSAGITAALPIVIATYERPIVCYPGLDARFVVHTPLMWIDKAATFALAQQIGGPAFVDLLVGETHTCYLGDRTHRHDWGFGCGTCPACRLRAEGFAKWKQAT